MDLLRSEPMQLVQLIIPTESAHRTISYLGDLGLFQFKDLNAEKSPFQRTYAAQVKFEELEEELVEVNTNNEKLQQSYNELLEYKLVLQKASEIFHSAESIATAQHREIEVQILGEGSIDSPLLLEQEMSMDMSKQVNLGFICGLVMREKSMAFERMLFRATRGNVFMRQVVFEDPLMDPVSGDKVDKNVFVIFYSGERAKSKILKICDAFGANCYPFTDDLGKQYQMITEVSGKLSELKTTIDVGMHQRATFLNSISCEFEQWSLLVGALFLQQIRVAKYQEANPGVYAIVTFPFLFAVMFGDWGHGMCLLLATLYLIFREKKLSNQQQKLGDIMELVFGGRYVILMMALFSIYTGFIYNEFFSVPFELFGHSAYGCRDSSCRDASTLGLVKVHNTYPFGVDPKWHGSRSELPFLNSLKMKMSILLCVGQMNLGIVLSYFNAKFFGNDLNVRYQFVPQMIFLNSLFGYLSLLIIVKWCTGSQVDLYHVMIYMFLSPTDDLGENQLFVGQKYLQLVLLMLAVVAVPWMLIPKPLLLKRQHEERYSGKSYQQLQITEDSFEMETHGGSNSHEEFQFSEVFVYQLIHTIEFVLGAVSNTASYLRLWALSLAHSELSSVFYEKVLLLALGFNNVVILVIGIIVFVLATLGVLLLMETLSAFLHALRLQWVEFQNKFYEGDGYKFCPFSFTSISEDDE